MTFRVSRPCTRRLRSIFPGSRPEKNATTVITISLWKILKLEPGPDPVAK
jgi:hypothetical protein